ncbi:MAG: hypothetical protein U0359_42145 [Byssovorax sp.]
MLHRDRRVAVSLAALLLPLCLAQAAWAEDAPNAAELRDKARTALTSGDVAGACLLFEQSYQASKAAGSAVSADDALFDLATCHEKLDKRAVASAEYEQLAAGGGPRAADAKARLDALKGPPPGDTPAGNTPAGNTPAGNTPAGNAPTGDTPPAGNTPVAEPPKKEEAPTRIGDFMDTRLSWTFGDDDVLHATGQAFPLSPNASVGDRKQYRTFFDNLNSRFGGRENLTHLALYKKLPGFIDNLDTEASLVLRFDIGALSTNTNNVNQAFYDAGSFIRAFYHTSGGPNGKTGLGLTLWPLDTDRFRLGYLYDISWGGTNATINQSIFPRIQGSAPGAKLQYDGDGFSVFAGFKTASIVQVEQTLVPGTSEVEQIRLGQTNIGFLAGGAVDAGDYVHIDLGGGYFQQGKFDLPDVQGKPVFTYGGSARVVVHAKDAPVAQSIDFLLYRNDPNKPQVIFKPETYAEGKTTWSVSAEYDNLFQNLKDFETAGATRIQQARAAALQANLKSSFLRASLTGIFRDLPFVLRNQPSFIPFETLPKAASTTNELFFAAAVDYYLPSAHLTPGLGAGVQLPATFKSTTDDSSSSPIERTVVVREQGNIAILPINKGSVPIFQARVSLKWDISRILSALVWAQYFRDNNGTFVARDPSEGTVALRTFIKPDFFGLGTSVQARF